MLRLCYKDDGHPYIGLSICNVGGLSSVQEKVENQHVTGQVGLWLPAAEADRDHTIVDSDEQLMPLLLKVSSAHINEQTKLKYLCDNR